MSRTRPPSYRLHRASNQAIVTIPLPGGKRKDLYLGVWKSAASKAEYARIVAELGVAASPGLVARSPDRNFSVNELLVAFLQHADAHYRRSDGTATHEPTEFRASVKPVRLLYGMTRAGEFGPLALKAVRQWMVTAGWCRSLINQRIGRVKRMFKWAASEELVPAAVFHGLTTVAGIQRGRTVAPERDPIRPVDEKVVAATLPYLTRQVAGLVRFILLTGCRPGEACMLRRRDIDTTGPVWHYRPAHHKLAHRGKSRVIAVGPRAQGVLGEFPAGDPDDFVFSPARAVAERLADRAAARATPLWPSHARRNASKRNRTNSRPPGDRYQTLTLGRAVAKAIERANAARERMAGPGNYERVPHWHPNQLRHSHATKVRALFGLEAAQVALGHSRADVTQIYAERNLTLAIDVAHKVG